METGFRSDFKDVRIHTNDEASNSANRLGAAAYTAGNHIVFGPGQYAPETETGDRLLRHELAHATQQPSSAEASTTMSLDQESERFAESCSNHWPGKFPLPSCFPPAAIRPSVASKIIKWAAKKLEKRTAKLISKHIARHARAIAGRAVHSIFKNPRQIRALMKVTLKEALEVAARHAGAGTERVVEEAGVRLTRQATGTPGKFRLVIDKIFQKEIGTAGERILRIVLDKSGRIVTAFPTDRLLLLGLTAAGLEVLTSGTAEAGGVVRDQAERQADAKQREEEQSSSWWEWIPIIGDIWGGSLNVGEGEALKEEEEERQIEKLIQKTIKDIENTEQRSFDSEHRQEIEDIIRTAITTPGILEEAEQEGEGE